MTRTLVTGANSFVAAHIIATLVKDGHEVVGAVRRSSSGDDILALHPEWKGKVSFVTIPDISSEEAWANIFKSSSIDHVIHTAAPVLDNPNNVDYDRDFRVPSVEGNLSLLRAAKAHAPSLRSIAVTGSINAVTLGSADENANTVYTSDVWNSVSADEARKQQNAYVSYCVGKKEAEEAIWEFVSSEKPDFTVTVWLPALILGPAEYPVSSMKTLNFSSMVVYSLINGSNKTVPPTPFASYVDVRDLARAHVNSLTDPRAANRRFLVGGEKLTSTKLVNVLKELSETGIPELKGRFPEPSDEEKDVVDVRIVADEGNAIAGPLRSAKETFGDAAKKLLEWEKKFAAKA